MKYSKINCIKYYKTSHNSCWWSKDLQWSSPIMNFLISNNKISNHSKYIWNMFKISISSIRLWSFYEMNDALGQFTGWWYYCTRSFWKSLNYIFVWTKYFAGKCLWHIFFTERISLKFSYLDKMKICKIKENLMTLL